MRDTIDFRVAFIDRRGGLKCATSHLHIDPVQTDSGMLFREATHDAHPRLLTLTCSGTMRGKELIQWQEDNAPGRLTVLKPPLSSVEGSLFRPHDLVQEALEAPGR